MDASNNASPTSSASDLPPSVQLQQLHLASAADDRAGEPLPSASTVGKAPADPVGSLGSPTVTVRPSAATLDLANEDAFPSLGLSHSGSGLSASNGRQGPTTTSWSNTAAPAIKRQGIITEILDLPLSQPGRVREFGDRTSTADVVRQVMKKTNTQIDVSTASQTQTMTFLIRGKTEQVRLAKRDILATLGTRVTVTLQVPSFVRPFILGARGRTLNAITQQTGTKIHIPRRDEPARGTSGSGEEDDHDAVSEITITGDLEGVSLAKSEIEKIVNEKTSRRVVRLTHIPASFYPLITGAYQDTVNQLMADYNVKIRIPAYHPATGLGGHSGHSSPDSSNRAEPASAITVSGDKDALDTVVDALNSLFEELSRSTRTVTLTIPKRQHRFLVGGKGSVVHEVLAGTGCSMELPPASDPLESVVIRGPEAKLIEALTLVMDKTSDIHVDSVDLLTIHHTPSPADHAAQVLRYLTARNKLKSVELAHSAKVHLPRHPEQDHDYTIEVVTSSMLDMINARQALVELLKGLPPHYTLVCPIEPHLHGHLMGRHGQNAERIHSTYGVDLVFGDKDRPQPDVLLVYDENPLVDSLIHDKRQHADAVVHLLQQVARELTERSRKTTDHTTQTLHIPARYHRYIQGPDNARLDAVLGSGSLAYVVFGDGTSSGGGGNANQVTIQGPTEEVTRVAAELARLSDEAREQEALNSYASTLSVPQQHLPHVIGKGGANLTRLKDQFDVKIDVDDRAAANSAPGTATITLKGSKDQVEAGQAEIEALVDRLADHTVSTLRVDHRMHRALIGAQGRFVKRLEDKYGVFIKFPRSDSDATSTNDDTTGHSRDDIIIKGGRKGVEAAKQELQELAEYEEANNQSISFTIPARSLPHVVGRSGAKVNEIKNLTNARIDLGSAPPGDDRTGEVSITIRGTRKGIQEARQMIQAVVKEQKSLVTVQLPIDAAHHRFLIGSGGSKIRELIEKCGGDQDLTTGPKACRVLFPRKQSPEDEANVVTVKGDQAVVAKVVAKLEALANELKERVCTTVNIPVSEHPLIIGRGGATLRDIQAKHKVDIEFPHLQGSHGRHADAAHDPTLVRIHGKAKGCQSAANDLLSRVRTQERIAVPLPLHQLLGGSGSSLWRSLRSDLNVFIDPEDQQIAAELPADDPRRALAQWAPAVFDDLEDEYEEGQYEMFPGMTADTPKPRPHFEPGVITWVLKGNQKAVDKAKLRVEQAVEQAKSGRASCVDYLWVPGHYHRFIVGRGGSTIARLRKESDCQVELPRGPADSSRNSNSDDSGGGARRQFSLAGIVPEIGEWVTLIGSSSSIRHAKQLIEDIIDESAF
ncbi:hypothetical protein H4R34_002070 [Dimargaris verticillata]|uniref:K Homology domain-containing protein n=1 Tax=Dimargaris verticillata TaxID=2761393 RepID=A0A9W8EEE8_9FUNG|nr:hypothetical protein H4R34_002070 [Dimargaris verticillata]